MIDQSTKNICHLIRQAFKRVQKPLSLSDAQCQELAIAFTFLRRIDCLTEQYCKPCSAFYNENREKLSDKQLDKELRKISGGYHFYNVSGYNFNGLLNSGLSVEVAIMSYIQGLSPNVRQILQDMNFADNIATLMRQSKYLVDIFEVFSDLNLSLSGFNNHRFIDLITTLASDGFKHNGLCPTPIGLSKLICECLFCKEVCEGLFYDEMSIYDPVCGTGSLLAYAGERAKTLNRFKDVYLIGKEISSFSCAIANALVLLTGDEYSFVDDVNTLTEVQPYEKEDDDYCFVVADLPVGLPWTPIKERIEEENQKKKGRFSKGLPSTNDSQFLFIQDIVSKMDDISGRAAFITSGSVLNGGSVKSGESRIRRWLFESGLVETIIALPSGILLPYTNSPAYLWILCSIDTVFNHDNVFWEKMEGKVRLIDTSKLISSQKQFKLDDEFIGSVVREYKSLKDTVATRIVKTEDLGFYEVNIKEGSKKETVKISLDTNIHEYIEKERKPYAKGEIVIEFSSVEKGYSIDFSQFFKPEVAQIPSLKEESDRLLSVVDTVVSLKNEIYSLRNGFFNLRPTETWREIPLRAAIEFRHAFKSVSADYFGLPIFSLAYLKADLRGKHGGYLEINDGTKKYKIVGDDDVVFVKSGTSAGEIFKPISPLISPSLEVIRCTNESILCPNYLYYLLKGYEKSFKLLATGSAMKSISISSMLDFKCLLPPVEEQKKIVAFLDVMVGKIDDIIKELDGSDNIFTNYRQTLIENVVRGRM